ncbi:MAG: SusC/RagA family TonB-linked outer membrane protein [Candidatus Pseudobacter hemicellulosilyticus]|uniref:SusC/RagA family TonB-linked outer membrane protein n=1 Tax=Candidatus Pseudobacter hemicellulosilyticus TaxID=3121375 RepID=A0AAJ5WMX8_9BACT|nr:MAG: SusC/RagA family TonB-linked outer membrane protein [Pseudobacter sp.]
MRLLTLLLITASVAVAENSHSQVVSYSGKEVVLKKVLGAVEKQTGFVFFYNQQLLANTRPVTISASAMPLESFLQLLLKDQPLNYRLDGQTITLSRKPVATDVPAFTPLRLNAPDTTIRMSGTVLSPSGEPIVGASVVIKTSRIGVSTDVKGHFSISAQTGQVLVVSYVGYEDQEVRAKAGTPVIVRMNLSDNAMKDAVVTGIYQRKKESFTGSSSTYTAQELKVVGNQNVLQSLRTLDPAFAIVDNNIFGSDPNRLPDLEIRGKSSINGLTDQYGANPNQPLFILDGFESTLTIISDLSMDRIESITILKDAAATAIYGSRAANGVVVVETKKPLPGKLRFSYNLNSSINFADLSDYNLMNAAEKLEFEKLSGFYGTVNADGNFLTEENETRYLNRLRNVARGVDTYWPSEPLRVGALFRHTLMVEGGDANLRYSGMLTRSTNQGVMKGSDRNVTGGNVRLLYRKGRLSFSNSLSVDMTQADRETVPFSRFSRANPYHPKYNASGGIDKIMESYNWVNITNFQTFSQDVFNPLWDLNNNNLNTTKSQGFTNNFEVEWRVIDALRARGRFSIRQFVTKQEVFKSPFNSEYHSTEQLLQGSFAETNDEEINVDGDFNLTYSKLFGGKHMVNAVGGFRAQQLDANSSGYTVRGFLDDEQANPAFAIGFPQGSQPSYRQSRRRNASFLLNAGYAYDDRYLFDASIRSDGSSVFGASKNVTNIWSLGLGWNLHKEAFFRNSDLGWLNTFRLRFSVGNPGNQNFEDYISMQVYKYNLQNRNPFGTGVVLDNVGNANLEWQQTLDKNFGMDMTLLNDRLRVVADYFHRVTDPLLLFMTLPASAGLSTYPINLGGLLTKGFTLSANYTVVRTKDVNWMLNMNMRSQKSTYRNMGDALKGFNDANKNETNEANVSSNLLRYYDGGSPTDLWAVRSVGIDPATGREIFLNSNGQQTFVHNPQDEQIVGNSEPKLDGIIGTSVRYKGFSASINLRYRLGGQVFMQTLFEKVENIKQSNVSLNQDKRALYDRWKNPGDNAKFKSISQTATTPMSSRFVEDNNVLAGESFSVGYETTTAKWLKAIGAGSMNFRAYMNDIFRLATVKNERGLDYPFARSVSFSVGVRF